MHGQLLALSGRLDELKRQIRVVEKLVEQMSDQQSRWDHEYETMKAELARLRDLEQSL